MAQGNYPNSGVLFKNDRKAEPKHPDYKGELDVDGQKFWLSAWIKDGRAGKFLSLSITPKQAAGPRRESPPSGDPAPNDEIPF